MSMWSNLTGKVKSWFVSDAAFLEAAGEVGDEDLEGWRPITQDVNRNLDPVKLDRSREIACKMWERSPLGNRMTEIPLAYLLAEGVTVTHENEELNDVIRRFWNDPINNWPLKLEKRVRELSLLAEQFWITAVNQVNGHVRIGALDPKIVNKIIFDPDNAEQPVGVETTRDAEGNIFRYKVIINGPEHCFSPVTQALRETFTDGELFYFNINAIGNQARGRPDLLAEADFVDVFERLLFGESDRVDFIRSFFMHIQVEDADDKEIKKTWLPKFKNPFAKGQNVVTNGKVKMNAIAPNLGTSESDVVLKTVQQYVLASGTIPSFLFDGGGETNRSTSESMLEPFEKVLTMRQNLVREMLKSVVVYALRQYKMIHNNEGEPDWDDEIYKVSVNMPEMTAKDTSRYAAALSQLTAAVLQLIHAGLMTDESAIKMINSISTKLGVEFDAKTELENAAKTARDKQRKQEKEDWETEPENDDVAENEQEDAA